MRRSRILVQKFFNNKSGGHTETMELLPCYEKDGWFLKYAVTAALAVFALGWIAHSFIGKR